VRKWIAGVLLGTAVAGAGIGLAWVYALRGPAFPVDEILARYREGAEYGGLTIRYPLDGTLFPPEIVPPTFRWEDGHRGSDAWIVAIAFQDGQGRMSFPCFDMQWTPSDEAWATIKRRSLQKPAEVTILGVRRRAQNRIVSAAGISISTSEDEVAAPIFYREVNLPFIEAVKDPSHIRWRFGAISCRRQPPIVLEKLPVCGNCHSFSADGTVLGMDVDYANDKGSYAVGAVAEEMLLEQGNIITWSDYQREDGELTFGLLSQVSPDGRYVVSTVKDRSVFVAKGDLWFSQLFFPIKGILVVYDRETRRFRALPGADDKRFVQSNPTWSPDGQYLVFARNKMHQLKNPPEPDAVLLDEQACAEFLAEGKPFRFDLYRIPFNGGKGGKAEPIEGASQNGMSNYFARYSPDGKWIVFCQARSFMLLQPDSELYIIPAEGGEARRLRCNTPRMNSWHSWSPNGRWLVFSSKWNSPYTQLFLTHIDDRGRSTPPVLLSQFTASDRAANIPEFVNTDAGAIERIRERFVGDASYLRAGLLNVQQGYHLDAVRDFRRALELDPDNVDAHVALAASLTRLGKLDEAHAHLARAIELAPQDQHAHEGLGNLLAEQGRFPAAADCFREAVRIDPELASAHFRLGVVLTDLGNLDEGIEHLADAVRLEPDDSRAVCSLGLALCRHGELHQAAIQYRRALELDPHSRVALLELASIRATSNNPTLRNGEQAAELAVRACKLTRYEDTTALVVLSQAFAEMGRFPDAVAVAEQALEIARVKGNDRAASLIRECLDVYGRREPYRRASGP
jgi:tetratricopeptide (TPR) repeat protein